MRHLAAGEVLSLRDAGMGRDDVDRALMILVQVIPGSSTGDLARLPVGQRDTLLFGAYSQMFGRTLEGVTRCPACGEPLECQVDIEGILDGLDADMAVARDTCQEVIVDGIAITFRLPTSEDLHAIAACESVGRAERILLERCVISATRDGKEIGADAMPESARAPIARAMGACDPAAIVSLDLSCPACAHGWQVPLNIVSCLWDRITAAARRLIYDVDTLARAYGWREADILAMSAARRQCYIDMVT